MQRRASTTMVSGETIRGVGRFAVAPMMDVTDRHFRVLAREISRHATLWTEMVVDRTLIHSEFARDYELALPANAAPTVLQLGGSEPALLGKAAAYAAGGSYAEVNLNCGCPSPRVAGRGAFGAALMREPDTVADAMVQMANALPGTPVSVKCRLGVDEQDDYEHARAFVTAVSERATRVQHFIVHARKALLKGLSPKQNREVPPLRHDYVYRLIEDFPHLRFTINGGIKDMDAAVDALNRGAAGVMLGRAVRDRPWNSLCDVDAIIYDAPRAITRRSVLDAYCEYAAKEEADGCPTRVLVKPFINLFVGEPRGKMFRRVVDQQLRDATLSTRDIVDAALGVLEDSVVDALPPSIAPRGISNFDLSLDRSKSIVKRSGVLM